MADEWTYRWRDGTGSGLAEQQPRAATSINSTVNASVWMDKTSSSRSLPSGDLESSKENGGASHSSSDRQVPSSPTFPYGRTSSQKRFNFYNAATDGDGVNSSIAGLAPPNESSSFPCDENQNKNSHTAKTTSVGLGTRSTDSTEILRSLNFANERIREATTSLTNPPALNESTSSGGSVTSTEILRALHETEMSIQQAQLFTKTIELSKSDMSSTAGSGEVGLTRSGGVGSTDEDLHSALSGGSCAADSKGSSAGNVSESTNEILRSLRETESQRSLLTPTGERGSSSSSHHGGGGHKNNTPRHGNLGPSPDGVGVGGATSRKPEGAGTRTRRTKPPKLPCSAGPGSKMTVAAEQQIRAAELAAAAALSPGDESHKSTNSKGEAIGRREEAPNLRPNRTRSIAGVIAAKMGHQHHDLVVTGVGGPETIGIAQQTNPFEDAIRRALHVLRERSHSRVRRLASSSAAHAASAEDGAAEEAGCSGEDDGLANDGANDGTSCSVVSGLTAGNESQYGLGGGGLGISGGGSGAASQFYAGMHRGVSSGGAARIDLHSNGSDNIASLMLEGPSASIDPVMETRSPERLSNSPEKMMQRRNFPFDRDEPDLEEQDRSDAAAASAGDIIGGGALLGQTQNPLLIDLAAKEAEWKSRRDRIARYSYHLTDVKNRLAAAGGGNAGNSGATAAEAEASTPAAPIASASAGDKVLLSPFVDLRKNQAVTVQNEGGLFRERAADDGGDGDSGGGGGPAIALANPVATPGHPSSTKYLAVPGLSAGLPPAVEDGMGPRPVVGPPATPPPPPFVTDLTPVAGSGKTHYAAAIPGSPAIGPQQEAATTHPDLAAEAQREAEQQRQRRRREVEEEERKAQHEEEIERGLELVLLAILDQANLAEMDRMTRDRHVPSSSEGQDNEGGDLIESAFWSLFGGEVGGGGGGGGAMVDVSGEDKSQASSKGTRTSGPTRRRAQEELLNDQLLLCDEVDGTGVGVVSLERQSLEDMGSVETGGSSKLTAKHSVVEELLAEDDGLDGIVDPVGRPIGQHSKHLLEASPQTTAGGLHQSMGSSPQAPAAHAIPSEPSSELDDINEESDDEEDETNEYESPTVETMGPYRYDVNDTASSDGNDHVEVAAETAPRGSVSSKQQQQQLAAIGGGPRRPQPESVRSSSRHAAELALSPQSAVTIESRGSGVSLPQGADPASQLPPSLVPLSMSMDGMMGVEAIHVNLYSSRDSSGNTSLDGRDGGKASSSSQGGSGGVVVDDLVPGKASTSTSNGSTPQGGGGGDGLVVDVGGNDNSGSGSKVLGPLSKEMGGTTGVVLDDHHVSSQGGRGVAADISIDVDLDEVNISSPQLDSDEKGSGGPAPVSPSSFFDTLTNAVSNAPNIMTALSRTLSHEEGKVPDGRHGRYSMDDDLDDDNSDDDEDEDDTSSAEMDLEARELMRSLCAHLLPYGVDDSPRRKNTGGSSSSFFSRAMQLIDDDRDRRHPVPGHYPSWDDDDPDELGYTVHRLTKSQLRRVEREFERMVNRVRYNSQRGLMGQGGGGDRKRAASSGSAVAGSSSSTTERGGKQQNHHHDDGGGFSPDKEGDYNNNEDAEFERDLEEAEELLDREERRFRAVEKAAAAIHVRSQSPKTDDDDNDVEDNSPRSSGENEERHPHNTSASSPASSGGMISARSVEGGRRSPPLYNPDFPHVRPSGEGKVGELEFFHLPIIFKAHVTGFEPTKDLILEPGNIVAGQYLVQGELGSAAFSTAYRCIDLSSPTTVDSDDEEEYHEEVCLKVIKNTKDFFDQSLDEIKILELLRQTNQCHDNNIVEMKTFFYHREHLVIVTELLRQNLFEYGKFILDNDEEPYFTRRRLCYITRQILVALNFIHNLGLVHSDVKPENILLSSYSRARVKLIDFGSSCYLTDRQSSYIQSRSYRAPEVILGLPYDGKIDIWSLGCVVAEMYTGQVTFQNDSVVSMLSRIEAICGPFPRHMIAQGRQSGRFFTSSGLLYETVQADGEDSSHLRRAPSGNLDLDDDDDDEYLREGETYFEIFQPKTTTLAARLGFEPDLMEKRRRTLEEEEKALFVDFVRSLLIVDPDSRPSARRALEHPWILLGHNMTEEDILYPSR